MQLTIIGGIGMALEGDEKKTEPIKPRRHTPFLADPTGFLVVQHDALNDSDLNIDRIIENSFALGKYTRGRPVVPAGEGDLFMLPETGDLILTHQNLGEVTRETFSAKRAARKAAYFSEVLEKYELCSTKGLPGLVLCLELKYPTSSKAIAKAQLELAQAGIGVESVYFDSFFGSKLDLVEGRYAKSRHLAASLGGVPIGAGVPKQGYDLVTVPRTMAFGEPNEQTIYEAVGSLEEIRKAADNPLVLGVYARIKE